MNIRDRQGLKSEAKRLLAEASFDPRKLVLLHTGASALLLLVITAINFALSNQMDSAVGLRGLDTRTILGTIQSALETVSTVALPFWNMGYIFVVMGWLRGKQVAPRTLLDGFRHFGPVLRLQLVKSLLFGGLATLCFYPSVIIFMLTPLANPMIEALMPIAETATVADMEMLMADPRVTEAIGQASLPMLAVFAVVFLLVALPMFYRLRMSEYALVDDPKAGAFAALRASRRMMRGNCLALLRLDLSFWWFYALELLLAVVCYGDALLPMVGVELPFSTTVAFFLFYILNLGGQVALYWWKKNEVTLPYAVAYETLHSAPPEPRPVAQSQIWSQE